jgi:outer membrane protein TolC
MGAAWAALAISLAASAAAAQGTKTISLDEAVKLAQSKSPAVRVARAGVTRAEGQHIQARSQLFPQLSGSANYTRTLRSQYEGVFGGEPADTNTTPVPDGPCDKYLKDETATVAERLAGLEMANRCALGQNPFSGLSSLPFGQRNAWTLGLNLQQNLFAGGRIAAQVDVSEAGRRAAEIEVNAQEAQVTLDVTQAYYDAALADRLVVIADSALAQAESTLRQVQANHGAGSASEFELLRAQVTRDNQRPIVIQRRADRDVAYFRLKQQLNLPLETELALSSAIEDSTALPPGVTPDAWTNPDTATVSRAPVRQSAEAVRAQEGLLRVARSQRLPQVSLISQYGKVGYPSGVFPGWNDFRDNWTIGVSASIPILTGGRLKGDRLVAQGNLEEAMARMEQAKQFAALDARIAINALEQARAAWTASAGTVEQAQRAYGIAEVRYREGLSTQVELSDARLLLQQAMANRATTARNLQIARVRLALLPRLPLSTGANTQAAQQQLQEQLQQQQRQQQQQQQQQQNSTGTGGGV